MGKRRKIKVIYNKLGRSGAWGQTDHEVIEIDQRAKGKKHCEVLVHEALHVLFPSLEEEEIERKAILLTNTLWHEGYRRIDNDNSQELQDGKK